MLTTHYGLAAGVPFTMSNQTRAHGEIDSRKQGLSKNGFVVDSHSVTKRLQSELTALMNSADPGVSAFPDGDSLFSWVGTIQGAAVSILDHLQTQTGPVQMPADRPDTKKLWVHLSCPAS